MLPPLLSPARAAQELRCELWLVDLLINRRLLHVNRVDGLRKVRTQELHAFRRLHDPSYRDPRFNKEAA
jgi:hypothetical protein